MPTSLPDPIPRPKRLLIGALLFWGLPAALGLYDNISTGAHLGAFLYGLLLLLTAGLISGKPIARVIALVLIFLQYAVLFLCAGTLFLAPQAITLTLNGNPLSATSPEGIGFALGILTVLGILVGLDHYILSCQKSKDYFYQ